MIAYAGAMRMQQAQRDHWTFTVQPCWELDSLPAA
jgi:tRNA A37 threonylcarbamoyltransferase TsaD